MTTRNQTWAGTYYAGPWGTVGEGRWGYKNQSGNNGPGNWCNEYIMTYQSVRRSPCNRANGNSVPPVTGQAPALEWSMDPIEIESKDKSIMYARIAAQIREHDFNAAVTAAESTSTLPMITNSANSIANALDAAASGNMSTAARILAGGRHANNQLAGRKGRNFSWRASRYRNANRPVSGQELANQWLALQWGWKPLLNDAYNAGTAFGAMCHKGFSQVYRANVKVRKEERRIVKESGSLYVIADGYGISRNSLRAFVKMKESMAREPLQGLEDPTIVLWELTPYSAVADWFVPIGDYLQAMSTLRGAAAKDAQMFTTEYQLTLSHTTNHRFDRVLRNQWISGGSSEIRRVKVIRKVASITGMPYPRPRPMSEALSFSRCVTAVALVTSKGTGRKTN